MSAHRIYALFLRQYFLIRHSPQRIISIFYWTTLELFIWGIITKHLHTIGGENFNFITVILGAIIFWNFFTRLQQGISIALLEDVWSRNLINLFASPLRLEEYIGGLVLTGIVQTTLSIIGMVILAWLLFAYNIFQFGFLILPFALLLLLFGTTIGVITTAAILRFGPSVEVLAWSIPILIMPFAAIFYPIEALPTFLQPIAYIVPISYVFEGMRNIVLDGTFHYSVLWKALMLNIVFLILAFSALFYTYRLALKRGLFSKFLIE